MELPPAKLGRFHTCLTAPLNPGRQYNELFGGNVLAYAQTPLALSAFQILLLQCSSAHRFTYFDFTHLIAFTSRVFS